MDNMIKKYSAILVAALLLVACAKEPEEPAGIIMTTKDSQDSQVSFSVAGARNIAVNWGDGKQSNVDDATVELSGDFMFSHVYSGTAARNIVITGNVTSLSSPILTALDVSRCATLEWLYCDGCLFTTLDVSKNTALTFLGFGYSSQITTLDVSKNTALKHLYIIEGQLKDLDVSANTALTLLNVKYNQLTAAALNDLFISLPDKTDESGGSIYIMGNPGTFECDRSIAEKKGWVFVEMPFYNPDK